MMSYNHDWQMSQAHSLDIDHEHRLTQVEMISARHKERHDTQDVWNKGFAGALIMLASAVGHSKMETFVDLLRGLLTGLL